MVALCLFFTPFYDDIITLLQKLIPFCSVQGFFLYLFSHAHLSSFTAKAIPNSRNSQDKTRMCRIGFNFAAELADVDV
jgi:hypothetical protein